MINRIEVLMWMCSMVVGATIVAIMSLWNNVHANLAGQSDRQLRSDLACNTLSYVYIVGVEGVGHHAVSPAIAAIAKTCNKHVIYEMRQLRADKEKKLSKVFQGHLEKIATTHYESEDVVIIEDSSFPTGRFYRNVTSTDKRSTSTYDLAWTHNELMTDIPHMNVKYLYLNRDFYRTVASHPEFDGSFQQHAQILYSFVRYLDSEYHKIDKKHPDIWRQISYEWFTNMDTHNCTAIVSAVIDFLQWDHCDVEFACHALNKLVRSERKKEVVPEDLAYSQQFNVTLPIPVLDISPNRSYSFKTAVFKHREGFRAELALNRSMNILSVLHDAPPKPEHVRSSLSGTTSHGLQGLRGAQPGGRFKAAKLPPHCDFAGKQPAR